MNLERLQEKFYELEDMTERLTNLADDVTDIYYKDQIKELIFEAKREMEELAEIIAKLEKEEIDYLKSEYERNKL